MRKYAWLIASIALSAPGWGAVVYVDTNGTGNGSSWGAASSLSNALTIANTGDELWIAQGAYTNSWDGTNSFVITNNISLYGGFTNGMAAFGDRNWSNYPTILDGAAARRVALITAANTVLDGLRIQAGTRPLNGVGIYKATAGTLTLANCMVASNRLTNFDLNGAGGYFSGCAVTISNCTFVSNVGNTGRDFGVGFYALNANISLNRCMFTNNYSLAFSGKGGAFYASGGSLTASNCIFVNNRPMPGEGATIHGGGGGYLGGACSTEFRDCIFRANTASYGGGLFVEVTAGTTVSAVNCTFAENAAINNVNPANGGMGGVVYAVSGKLNITNCTIAGNSATRNGGAFYLTSASVAIGNSILWNNEAALLADELYNGAGTAAIDYSCLTGTGADDLYGVIALGSVLTNNPLFANPYTDLHLQSVAGRWDPATGTWSNDAVFSPCIDAGNPASAYSLEPDYNGGRINLGAEGNTTEASKSPAAVAPAVANRGAVVTNNSALLSGELVSGTRSVVTIYYGVNAVNLQDQSAVNIYPPQDTGTVFSGRAVGLLPSQLYYYACFATNAAGTNWAAVDTFTTGAKGPGGGAQIIHVDQNALLGAQNGSNWFDAYRYVAAGLAAARGTTNEIWVAKGAYAEGAVTIATNLSLYGWFAGWETNRTQRASSNEVVLNGANLSRVLNITGTNVVLDGLSIVNGGVAGHGAGISKINAGYLTLANCTIASNHTDSSDKRGNGCYLSSCSAIISNCTFSRNNSIQYRTEGIGLYALNASVLLDGCTFVSNYCSGKSIRGGAFYCSGGTLSALNCVFAENTINNREGVNSAGGGAGGYLDGANSAQFQGCVFRSNTVVVSGNAGFDPDGGGLYIAVTGARTASVMNCTFAWNYIPRNGGAIYLSSGKLDVTNSIFWGNTATNLGREIYAVNITSIVTAAYSDFTGTNTPYVATVSGASLSWGLGIQSSDPLFASATDLHLKSFAGRWDPLAQVWIKDPKYAFSLCIDAGDPASSYVNEPDFNGRRINLGAYGNTWQASKTLRRGTVLIVY